MALSILFGVNASTSDSIAGFMELSGEDKVFIFVLSVLFVGGETTL